MPNRSDIQNEILRYKNSGQDVLRREYLSALHNHTQRDTIVYASSYAAGKGGIPPVVLSIATEDIQGFMAAMNGLKGQELDLILHSPGGSLEAAEQIVNYSAPLQVMELLNMVPERPKMCYNLTNSIRGEPSHVNVRGYY